MLKQFAVAVLLAGVAAPMAITTPAFAQDGVAAPINLNTEVTEADVLSACATDGADETNCKAVIAAYFEYLESQGIVGADLQAAIADLVVALAETGATGDVKAVVVAAIADIGTNYATGTQATAIMRIAQAVEDDEEIVTADLGISEN